MALPPLPLKVPALDMRGLFSREWEQFFRDLVTRVGGNTGSSTTTLAAQIAALQTSLTASASDLSQGRQL